MINSRLLQGLLEKSPLTVERMCAVESLGRAFELLNESKFDVVLLDLNLPDSEGLDTLENLVKRHSSPAIVVITGNYDDDLGLKAVSSGAQEYLVKGRYDMHLLVKSVYYAIERKRAQEQLRRSEQRANAILQNTGDAMRVVDVDYNVILTNNEMAHLTGVDADRALGSKCYDQLEDRLCNSEECILRRILAGEEQVRIETVIKTADRDEVPVEVIAAPLVTGDTITGMVESYRDITERVLTEQATKQAYENELDSKETRLTEVQRQLVQSEKLASIGQLAAGVAHEMNTPLGFVASNFETLEKYIDKIRRMLGEYEKLTSKIELTEDNGIVECARGIMQTAAELKLDFILEDIEDLFEESKDGIQRVTSIIQNLRDFSRVDQSDEAALFNINKGIEATLVVARNEIKYDADVETDLGEIAAIRCNSGQINQVFLNILVNAAHAIKSCGLDGKGLIRIRTYAEDGKVVCEISDNGCGIEPDKLGKIFDPFFTTKAVGKGTGLGLSLSYDIIVNKHKGQLLVDSEPGKGTTFTIKLPVAGRETVAQDADDNATTCVTC